MAPLLTGYLFLPRCTSAAAAQRAKQFADAETSRRLVAAAHVSFPGVGHIRADNQGYAWVPVDYRWRE